MNIYKLTNNGSVIRLIDGACIPPDPANLGATEIYTIARFWKVA